MTEIEGIVANNRTGVTDGSLSTIRITKTGETSIGATHGEFYEPTSRNNVFTACTAAAGVSVATLTIGTACVYLLYNPINSGVNLSIIQASGFYVSGTLAGGYLTYTMNSGVAVVSPTGTAIVARSALLTGGNAAPKGVALTSATTAATMTVVRPFCTLLAYLGTVVPPIAWTLKEQVNGEFLIPPGYFIGIHGVTQTGTSPVLGFSMTWEEVPIS